MNLLCLFGIHRWRSKETARPGVTIFRCERCNCYVRTEGNRPRRKKRWTALAVVAFSGVSWFATVNLVTTGHTRVIHTAARATFATDRTYLRARAKVRCAVGAPDPCAGRS